jgi:hypothetical protein
MLTLNELRNYILCAYGNTPQSRALISGLERGCSIEERGRLIADASGADTRIKYLAGRTNSKWVGDRKAA